MELMIRRCESVDSSRLAILAARLFRLTYAATHPEPDLVRYIEKEFSADQVGLELRDPGTRAWMALDTAGAEVGYVWQRDVPPPSSVRIAAQRPLHMRRIFVDPVWHGRGVAQALMAECIEEADRRGADALWLAVWRQATRPIAFYRKAGFAVIGTSTFTIGGHRDDDFIMARAVPEQSSSP